MFKYLQTADDDQDSCDGVFKYRRSVLGESHSKSFIRLSSEAQKKSYSQHCGRFIYAVAGSEGHQFKGNHAIMDLQLQSTSYFPKLNIYTSPFQKGKNNWGHQADF